MDFSNNRIDTQRRTAVYVRISTSMQKTDRQVEELVTFAKENKLNFNEKKDIYRDVISEFKDGEQRPMFSALMEKVRRGEYQQLLFSEFSRLDRKPSNLLRTLETLQKQNVYCWFNKQSIWVKEYVHEYIECITLYKPSPLWVLVIVRFVDGSERWGTIKNVRYAKKEVKRDGEYRYTMGFSGWFINNDRHSLSYDKTAHTITEKQTDGKKTYTFEEFDIIVQERQQTDFFEPYVFDVR